MRILPVYKGYSVDQRLQQFRKARLGKMVEFIDFDSPEGALLQDEMIEQGKSFEPADHETPEGWQYLKDLNIATYGRKEGKAMNERMQEECNKKAA